jgi:hypothetical protein
MSMKIPMAPSGIELDQVIGYLKLTTSERYRVTIVTHEPAGSGIKLREYNKDMYIYYSTVPTHRNEIKETGFNSVLNKAGSVCMKAIMNRFRLNIPVVEMQ